MKFEKELSRYKDIRNKFLNLVEDAVVKYMKGEIDLKTRNHVIKECYRSLPEINEKIKDERDGK